MKIYLFIFLFNFVLSSKCPAKEVIYRCECSQRGINVNDYYNNMI